jgi:hypothetical protein
MGRLFNGSSDVISNTSIATVGATGSMSLWLQPNWNGNDTVDHPFWMEDGDFFTFQKYSDNNIYCGFRRGASDQRISLAATGLFSSGTWAHWLLTWSNAAGQTLYKNGVSVGTHSLTYPSPVNPNGLWVGNYGTFAPVNANETIADFAYWNSTLSSSDAAKLAAGYRPVDVNSANLQVWWPLSGYSSPEPDISGNANNGTLTGTSQAPMPPSLGRGGRQFVTGTDQMNITFSPTSALTVSWWVFSSTLPSSPPLGTLSYDNSQQAIYLSGISYPLKVSMAGGPVGGATAAIINQGTWYNIIWTQTVSSGAGTYTIYLNGSSVFSDNGTLVTGFASGSHTWNVGNIVPAGTNPLSGYMADMAVWSTVLNGTQINQLVAGVRPPNVNSGNLIGWWPLDGFSNATENDKSGNGNNGTLTGTLPILGPPQLWRLG